MVEVALLAIAAVLYGLHFVHLRADFPNHSPWPDWAKFTDEGWYGSAAIRHYQLGHWYLPGDFNPAAALPILPLLEMAIFHFTGVSLLAARALTVVVFGLILLFCYLLLWRWAADEDNRTGQPSLAPAVAVLLLTTNPFFFAFSRLAILEPLMILLALASLLLAQCAASASINAWLDPEENSLPHSNRSRLIVRAAAWSIVLGLAVAIMVLTKTTGVFLLPAIAWMLWAGCSYRLRVFLPAGFIAGASAATAWGVYMLLFVRPRYLADYRYLFSANAYTGITEATFLPVALDTFFAGEYLGVVFFYLGVVAAVVLLASFAMRRFRQDALSASLLFWIFFYFLFLAYHDNLQARYYQVLGAPLAMLIAMVSARLWHLTRTANIVSSIASPATIRRPMRRVAQLAAYAFGAAIAFAALHGALQEITYTEHPEYTFVSAADQIRAAIEHQRTVDLSTGNTPHPETVLSISGATLSLITGLPSICDDFGAMTLPERIAAYKPGWYVAWNDVEDDKMEALAPAYRLVRVGAWPALDDPDRNLLILYRLDPLDRPGLGKGGNRRALNIPRQLRKQAAGPNARR